jgi:ectoine hydrolase
MAMPDVDLHFGRDEYADRLARTRSAMAAAGLDALVTVDPSNMAWLTGYDGWSFYTHQAVIVGQTGEPFYWGRRMDAVGATLTCWMEDANIVGYPDHYVMSTVRHPMEHLAALLRERGLARGSIGVELENYYFSAKAHAVLKAELTEAELVDATALVNWQRAVKSPAELRYMRRAARISERMQSRAFEVIGPGVRGNEVAAEVYRTAILGAEDEDGAFGGDYPAIAPLMPAGRDTTAAHLSWTDKPYVRDLGVFFEISGCVRRYHAPLCRTVWLGEPPAEMRRAEAALVEGIDAGIDAARAGNTAGDVARAFYGVLARHGIQREGRCGYPIGLSYPPDWGERTFSIRPEDETVLQPDMTFHFMPGLWLADWGLEITEPLRVRESGPAECLADYPRKLFVKQ